MQYAKQYPLWWKTKFCKGGGSMELLVYVETKEGKPVSGSLELLTPAFELGNVNAVLVGSGLTEAAKQVAAYGVPVSLMDAQVDCPDAVFATLKRMITETKPDVVLMSATQLGKELAPRLAGSLKTGCVTDATVLEAAENTSLIFTRPAYGGTILEHLTIHASRPQIATLRSGSYAKPAPAASAGPISITNIIVPADAVRAKIVKVIKEITEAINLEDADIIVSGGQGMGDADNFVLVRQLAELLGGVVGATRPAIEAGWVSRAHQVGQSGKIVAPRLYIACGISGAMQHISGILGAQYIVAINKDD
jgi:electron transfer flavoprotein alpha subunit